MTKETLKKCIWCLREEPNETFIKQAHTIPQTLGGTHICQTVCDSCNKYFGDTNNKLPAIETALKEAFNLSRLTLLHQDKEVGRNKSLARFKSIYFNVNLQNNKIKAKPAYQLKKDFQLNLGRQLKRGIFKIFLEERERQFLDGLDSKYNFIREFSRYNIGNLPVFYFKRNMPAFFTSKEWHKAPELFIAKNKQMSYLVNNQVYLEFELLGHVIGIPVDKGYKSYFPDYFEKTKKLKNQIFTGFTIIERFNDFNITSTNGW